MKQEKNFTEEWDLIVKPRVNPFTLNFKEVWAYKDLLMLLVKRDFVTQYKQTLLGPVWIIMQPLVTTIMFTITFSRIANIQTQGIPAFIYYLTGITFWNYFADSITKNANTFSANAAIFGKVYFPRLVMPLSMMISNILKLGIQFLIFLMVWVYFLLADKTFNFHPEALLLLPVAIVILGVMGSSIGLIVTSLTTKYRDFNFLVGYFVQFLMYASCVVLALPAAGLTRDILMFNPVVPSIESIKYIFLGVGNLSLPHVAISAVITVVLFLISVVVFNKTEKTFMDTV
jgi:lipopolysaccharide transport system permease protein